MTELQRLLRALWALARASASPRWSRRVEGERVLAQVLAELRPALDAAGAQLSGGSLPVVRADPRLLARVLRALVGNAARHHGDEPPYIHVAARPAGREWLFSVRDNGAGVDPRRHHAIFSAFSGATELPGCRRIIERHGGRMWVESARGHGATFYFSLPATREVGHDR
ncbi:MAG TPA: ATP-binding protein [Burkholderiales bacterium]|nr:ATP-binding protein [Burkholderiales bacterium]